MKYILPKDIELIDRLREMVSKDVLTSSKKCSVRVSIEYIVNEIVEEKFPNNSFEDFNSKIQIVCNEIIGKEFYYGISFLWKEGCNYGCHPSKHRVTGSGVVQYGDIMIHMLMTVIDKYFYSFRLYPKEQTNIKDYEIIKSSFFTLKELNHNKSPLRYLMFFLSVTIVGLLFFIYTTLSNQKSEFQKQEIVLPKNDTIVSRPSNTMTVGDSSSNNQQNIGSTVINGGNHTQNGNINETTNGDFHIKK